MKSLLIKAAFALFLVIVSFSAHAQSTSGYTCYNCNGQGSFQCTQCDQNGYGFQPRTTPFSRYPILSYGKCIYCNATKQVRCNTCYGYGVIYPSSSSSSSSSSSTYSAPPVQKQEEPCLDCNMTGVIWKDQYHWRSGKTECGPWCIDNHHRIDYCSVCKRTHCLKYTDHKICPSCKGAKVITK